MVKVDRAAHAKASIERQKLFLKLRQTPADQRPAVEKRRAELAKAGIEWAAANKADGAIAACGNLVFAGGNGNVTAYGADDGKQLWQAEVEGDVRGIAISEGTLLVSTTAGKIYAYTDADHTPDRTPEESAVTKYPHATKTAPYANDDAAKTYAAAAKEFR